MSMTIGISIGDPNGIGPEVVLKTFSDAKNLAACTPIIYAHVDFVVQQADHFNLQLHIERLQGQPKNGVLNVVDCWSESFQPNYGTVDAKAGACAVKSLQAASKALQQSTIDALVTAPIHKAAIQSEAFNFPGHTDFLAQEFGGEALMFLVHADLRVALVTDHVPVKDIAMHITANRIESKLKAVDHSLQQDFGITNPRIAVLGLNPHAGDQGVIGKEEINTLSPLLQSINIDKVEVNGPFSADAFFGSKSYKNYDAILAMYHDQGLIPFKTLSFGQGVNFTAGLSVVRTSPDHGTAFAIAGKGEADPESFVQAVQAAIEIVERRT
ncbi:MAG: 4-hydroxythreonine-4-phosphate dehydrogenase PdxA [Bacteroidota bacterium]|nr:4-hydroxythreonine-4-phosphate dehydrogenase PdxA [Bacteroidota bacterium]